MGKKFKFNDQKKTTNKRRQEATEEAEDITRRLKHLPKNERLHIVSNGIINAIKEGANTNHEQIDIVSAVLCGIALRLAPSYKDSRTLRESANGAYQAITKSGEVMLEQMLSDIEKEPGAQESFKTEQERTAKKCLISEAFEYCTDTLSICTKHAASLLVEYQLQSFDNNELEYGAHFEAFARLHLAETLETH